MAETYEYREVRDQGRKVVTGTLVGESEQLVIGRLRGDGLCPADPGARNSGGGSSALPQEGQTEGPGGVLQFATMVNSGRAAS